MHQIYKQTNGKAEKSDPGKYRAERLKRHPFWPRMMRRESLMQSDGEAYAFFQLSVLHNSYSYENPIESEIYCLKVCEKLMTRRAVHALLVWNVIRDECLVSSPAPFPLHLDV
jgi:hypothetical protein